MASSEINAFTYSCEVCGIESSDFAEYGSHIKSPEHLLEIKKISETPYEGHLPQRQPRVHRYYRNSVIPCTLCNMEMSGPISYQQHLEGRFHNMLLQRRMSEGSYYPGEGRSFYQPPMYLNSFPYYQRICNRRNSSYVQGVRSPYQYYAEGYYQPLWYAAGGSRQHVSGSHSSLSRNHSHTGLFHCRLCDTHHRSWSHYLRHLSMEHKFEEP